MMSNRSEIRYRIVRDQKKRLKHSHSTLKKIKENLKMNNIPIIIKLEQFDKSIYINVNHIVKIEANDDFQTDLLSNISLVDQTIINVFESQDEVIDKINRKIKSLRDLCRK